MQKKFSNCAKSRKYYFKKTGKKKHGGVVAKIVSNTLIALKYFFKSVNLSQRSVLQDMLRILKIMADFNRDREEHEISRNDPSEFVNNFCLNFSN